jgi:ubiquinone/menaquinone biosynthesis C-methylase UbiE
MKITQEKKSEISFFRQHANRLKDFPESPEEFYEEIFDLVAMERFPKNALILEPGCGTAEFGTRLSQMGYRIVGVDIVPELVRAANDRSRFNNLNFTGLVSDIERIPFKPETFDIVFCGFVLHHFRDIGPLMVELTKILKQDGVILIIEGNGCNPMKQIPRQIFQRFSDGWLKKKHWATSNERIHTVGTYVRVLKKNNFNDIKIKTFLPIVIKNSKFSFRSGMELIRSFASLLYKMGWVIFPEPFKGICLVISARKSLYEKKNRN